MNLLCRILFLAWTFSSVVMQSHADNHVGKKSTRSTQAIVQQISYHPRGSTFVETSVDVDSSMVLSSPGFPTPYQDGYKEQWVIIAPTCYVVEMEFPHGDVGSDCGGSFVYIYDQNLPDPDSKTTLCQGEIQNHRVVSAGHELTVMIQAAPYSGSNNTHIGIEAVVSFTNVCGPTEYPTQLVKTRPCRQQSSTNSSGTQLSSPAGRRGNCKVKAISKSDGVKIVVKSLDISDPSERLLLIGAGRRVSVTPSSNEGEYYFPSRIVFVRYSSSTSSSDKAFEIDIIGVDNTCGELINLAAGNRQISLDNGYNANTMCEWRIVAPEGQRIRLNFVSFDMGSCSTGDYVAVARIMGHRNYRKRVETFCGNRIPKPITSTGNKLRVAAYGKQGGAPGFTINVSSF